MSFVFDGRGCGSSKESRYSLRAVFARAMSAACSLPSSPLTSI
jgi:hypothetical protein